MPYFDRRINSTFLPFIQPEGDNEFIFDLNRSIMLYPDTEPAYGQILHNT